MAGIWYSDNNAIGKLAVPTVKYDESHGFSGNNYRLYFYALIQLSSNSVGNDNIPLLTVHNGIHSLDSEFKIYLNSDGQVVVENWKRSKAEGKTLSEAALPTDTLVELAVYTNVKGGWNAVSIWFNGVSQTVQNGFFDNWQSPWGSYNHVTIGTYLQVGQPKGLLILKGAITDESSLQSYTVPPESVFNGTLWRWDFEDSSRPLEINVVKANATQPSIDWVNTDATNIIWTEGNIPPASDTGGGGGIIIPGNDNTTRITGTITEDGVPVARRVIAVTEAQLEVEGSDETVHAVLDSTYSNPVTGDYTLDTSPYEGAVMAIATDNYGERWQANTAYSMADVIRPSHFQGYVYHCTTAGISDNTEPTWWFDINSVQNIGTAQFKAKPFARPLAHGPIIPDIIVE